MKKVASILLTVICFQAMSLWGVSAPLENQGQFQVTQNKDGNYLVSLDEKGLSIKSTFPGKPMIRGRSANYIRQNPLVQMSLLVVNKQNMSAKEIIDMMMNTIGKEYMNMNLKIANAQKTEFKQQKEPKGTKSSQQYIIDLENGMKEVTTLNVYQNEEHDIVVMSRYILSPTEKDNISETNKAKDIAENFIKNTKISFE